MPKRRPHVRHLRGYRLPLFLVIGAVTSIVMVVGAVVKMIAASRAREAP